MSRTMIYNVASGVLVRIDIVLVHGVSLIPSAIDCSTVVLEYCSTYCTWSAH